MSPDERIVKTFLWHGDKCFFVSTIDRDSSSMMGGRFAETIVWEFDWETNTRGAQLWMGSSHEGSIRTHQEVVERIHNTGSPEEPSTD